MQSKQNSDHPAKNSETLGSYLQLGRRDSGIPDLVVDVEADESSHLLQRRGVLHVRQSVLHCEVERMNAQDHRPSSIPTGKPLWRRGIAKPL